MRVAREIVLGVSLLVLVGCGGGGGGGGGGGETNTEIPPAGTCRFVLSGALTGSHGCYYATVIGSYLPQSGKSAVIHMFQGPGDQVGFGLALSVDGKLAPGTYTETSSGLVTAVVSAGTPTGSWSATVGLGPTLPDAGAFRVTISEVRDTSGANGEMFTIHGTVEATLPSRTGGASTVTMRGAF